jgi:hypothetical protein
MAEILKPLLGRDIGLDVDNNLLLQRPKDGDVVPVGSPYYEVRRAYHEVTSAEVLALFATPQAIVAAPGAGKAIVPIRAVVYKPAGTAYAGIAAGEDLVFKYTDASGAQCTGVIETTGFLDQTTAQTRVVGLPGATGATAGSFAPVADAAVVLHLLVGEITTGNSPLHVELVYGVIDTVFTA